MSRFVVIRVGELLPAEKAAERALAALRRQSRRERLQAHAREIVEAIRASHSDEDTRTWLSSMRELVSERLSTEPARVTARAAAEAAWRGEGDVPSAGGEP